MRKSPQLPANVQDNTPSHTPGNSMEASRMLALIAKEWHRGNKKDGNRDDLDFSDAFSGKQAITPMLRASTKGN